jgi:molybdopterin converting factor small subunit
MSKLLYLSRNLTSYTKGTDAFEVDGETVGECLDDFVNTVPQIKNEFFLSSGDRLSGRIQVKVNRKIVDAEDRLTKKITDGDEIDIALKGH